MSGDKYTNYLAASMLVDLVPVRHDGGDLIDDFEGLHGLLERLAGAEAADLLALPDRSVSKSTGVASVTWYTDLGGVFRSFRVLSQEEAAEASHQLRALLAQILSSASSAETPVLRRLFNLPSEDDIYFNGSQVVLTNWALLDKARTTSQTPVTALETYLPTGFAALGSEPDDPAQPAAAEDGEETTSGAGGTGAAGLASGALAAGALASEAAAAETRKTEAGEADPGESTGNAATEDASTGATDGADAGTGAAMAGEGVYVLHEDPGFWAHRRPVILWAGFTTLFLLLFLIYLVFPGNLIYPEFGVGEGLERNALEASNDAVIEDISRLQSALGGDVCAIEPNSDLDRIGGLPMLPAIALPGAGSEGGAPGGAVPVDPAATGQGEGARPENGADNSGEPDAQSAVNAPPAALAESSDLLTRLDQGTVFIIGSNGANGNGLSMGSGIFVGGDLVLTNRHVVEQTDGETIFVTNRFTGGPVKAQVKALSENSDVSGSDFALLKLERSVDLPRLPITETAQRLDSVVAAGYPSFVISSDPGFIAAFRSGDVDIDRLNDMQMAVTRGEITVTQGGRGGTTTIAHSATISPGNSGGPLIDMCGRVVGVNTYVRTDAENALRLNFALSARDAVQFLKNADVSVDLATGACNPAQASRAERGSVDEAPPVEEGNDEAAPAQSEAAAGPQEPAAPTEAVEPAEPAERGEPASEADALTVPETGGANP